MHKQEIIKVLNDVRESHLVWVNQGQIIVDGINLDRLEQPVTYAECEFSIWCESSKNNVSEFSWYEDIQEIYERLHHTYNDLFSGSMRKYKPKTMSELIEGFDSLKTESESFKKKLNEAESDLYNMTDEAFNDLIKKSNHVQSPNVSSVNSVKSSNKKIDENSDLITSDDFLEINDDIIVGISNSAKMKTQPSETTLHMQDVNIDHHHHNPFDELKSIVVVNPATQNDIEVEIVETEKDTSIVDISNSNSDAHIPDTFDKGTQDMTITVDTLQQSDVTSGLNTSTTANRHISLKEQQIIQLKQEKELSKLELAHAEETQKFAQQSVDQLQQYFVLKQEEIAAEQKDNSGFIEFKSQAKTQVEDELAEINEKRLEFKTLIGGLEKKNIEDELAQEKSEKECTIEKQFEELKFNKNRNLEELQAHKKVRENDLIKLKEQMLLLEEEISDMGEDIDKKQQDILDLEEKEQIKKNKHSQLKSEHEKVQQERNDKIVNMQKELDLLFAQGQSKQKALDTINYQVEELNKNNSMMVATNNDELKGLESQQDAKRKKLEQTHKMNATKKSEITDLELRIIAAERALEGLKADLKQSENEQDDTIKDDVELSIA